MTTDSEAWWQTFRDVMRGMVAGLAHNDQKIESAAVVEHADEIANLALAAYRERQKRGDFGAPPTEAANQIRQTLRHAIAAINGWRSADGDSEFTARVLGEATALGIPEAMGDAPSPSRLDAVEAPIFVRQEAAEETHRLHQERDAALAQTAKALETCRELGALVAEQRARAEAAELRAEVDENALRLTKDAMARDRDFLKEALGALAWFVRTRGCLGCGGSVLHGAECDNAHADEVLSKARAAGYAVEGETP